MTREGLSIAFRLPVEGWPRALFQSDFGFRGADLVIDGATVLAAGSREALEQGVEGALAPGGAAIAMQLVERRGVLGPLVTVAGEEALREDKLSAKPSRSAWIHAIIALLGSAAGFASSYVYLLKAQAMNSAWALKMGQH